MPRNPDAVQCVAVLKTGEQKGERCTKWAIKGGNVCMLHGGRVKRIRNRAAVRYELQQWVDDVDQIADPGEVLLKLVTQSAQRCAFYTSLLNDAYAKAAEEEAGKGSKVAGMYLPEGVSALIGATHKVTPDGRVYATEEAIRGLVKLENEERDRCANFATKAIAAGLAERQVRIAERQGAAIIEAITAAMDAVGLKGAQRQLAQDAAADRLMMIALPS